MQERTLNKHANQQVSISIGNPASTDSRDDGYVHLRIEDAASGETLCDVEIPAGRWHRLQLGSTQTWPGVVTKHPERIGKQLEVRTVRLPRDLGIDADNHHRELYRAVREQLPKEWHNYEQGTVRRTNNGWEGIIRRWVDASETQVQA